MPYHQLVFYGIFKYYIYFKMDIFVNVCIPLEAVQSKDQQKAKYTE